MDYLLKSSAVIILFYICYRFFLQRETFFIGNRWFLLLGLLSSMLVPLIVIPIYVEYAPIIIPDAMMYQDTVTIQPRTENTFEMITLIPWLYGIGVIFFLGKLAMELMSLFHLIKKHPIKKGKSFVYIKTDTLKAPFSFYNWIFYNPKQFDNNELKLVMNHEKVHARQLHTLDVHFAQLACAFMWFNPVMWMYKKALLQNLEFIADQEAQKIADCEKSYQNLLLKTSISNHQLALTNNFYNSLIKKRIVMLHKSKSKKINAYKYALVIPLLLLFVFNFNTETIAQTKQLESEKVTIGQNVLKFVITKDTKEIQMESIKEKLAAKKATIIFSEITRNDQKEIIGIKIDYEHDGTKGNFFVNSDNPVNDIAISLNVDENKLSVGQAMKNLSQSFELIKEDGKETKLKNEEKGGNVFVYSTDDDENDENVLVVGKDGEEHEVIKEKKVYVIKSGTTQDSDETDDVVFIKKNKKDTIWIKKDVKNIVWMDEDGNTGQIDASINRNNPLEIIYGDKKPLVILDGKKITSDELVEINPNNIMSMDVLKNEKSTKPYGEEGKHGGIIITTKKNIGNSVEIITHEFESDIKENYNGSLIYMSTRDKDLDEIKKKFKSDGVTFSYSKLKRNANGNITNIKVELSDANGKSTTATYGNDDGISVIFMGVESGNLFLKSTNK